MPAFLSLSQLAQLPLHTQLMLTAMVGSGVACLSVFALGALRQEGQRRQQPCPATPSAEFPLVCDQIYTALFMLFILWAAACTLMSQPGTPTGAASPGWGAILLGMAALIGPYLPMLVRYAMAHPWPYPTRPWHHYLALPLLAWATIYLSIVLLETSGFTAWLVNATGCPEHQQLVLTFSQGDTMQRLYIIICAVLIAPVVEECCFRGFLYTSLRRWGGGIAAALASSLLFGAIHASLAQLLPLTLFGVVQCLAYEKVRSLWLPIATHMLFNTTSLIATLLLLP